jgi:hypothetical protein
MPICPTCQGAGVVDQTVIDAALTRPGKTGRSHPDTSRRAGSAGRFGSHRR